jgi:hypothetical protein
LPTTEPALSVVIPDVLPQMGPVIPQRISVS